MNWFSGIVKAPPEVLPPVEGDERAEYGGWAEIVSGPHAGRYGVYTANFLERNGRPEIIMIKTRDANEDVLRVNYRDCRPSTAGRR